MKTLWLLRHARSGSGEPGQSDHERALSGDGRTAAARIGRYLSQREVHPDLVLCSSALRARQTLDRLGRELAAPLAVEQEEELYLASAQFLLRRIAAAPSATRSLLLVGHNPGIGELAARLAVRGPDAQRERLLRGYPAAALAEFRLDSERWDDLEGGCALAGFVDPDALRD